MTEDTCTTRNFQDPMPARDRAEARPLADEEMPEGWTAERLGRQRALRAAVLIDAIRCLVGAPGTQNPGTRRAAVRWVLSRDTRAPFSFDNVCESLGFTPSWIRHLLMTPILEADRPLRLATRSGRPPALPRRPRRQRVSGTLAAVGEPA